MSSSSIVMEKVHRFHYLKNDEFYVQKTWDQMLCFIIVKKIR